MAARTVTASDVLRPSAAPRSLRRRRSTRPKRPGVSSRTDPLTGLLLPRRMEPDPGRRGGPDQPLRPTGHGRDRRARWARSADVDPRRGRGRPDPAGRRRLDQPPCPRGRPRRPARDRAGSASCCPRPTRSRRSTTSSASARPASCGSNPGAIAMRLAIGWASPAADASLGDAFNAARGADVRGAASRRPARHGVDPPGASVATDLEGLPPRPEPGAVAARVRGSALSPGRGAAPGPASRRCGRRRRRPACPPRSRARSRSGTSAARRRWRSSGRSPGRTRRGPRSPRRGARRDRAARAGRPAPRSSCGSPPRG